ncbi:MAG: hypothetical protein KatS3mg085_008 [Candidatus Dojkabacteria bacterium]|nr:MAG: hypothetical protein KatS3mg085_008 [Candidatus Dojkabacteria bacterium]
MRSFIVIVFIASFCVILGLWSPWVGASIDLNTFFGVEQKKEISSLYVSSLSGELEVFIDGENVGAVDTETSPLIIDSVSAGEHLVSLRRKNLTNEYWRLNKLITFTPETAVVIAYNLGPNEKFSEGNIIYAVEKDSEDERTELTVRLNVEDAFVSLDDIPMQSINATTFKEYISLNQQHTMSVSKVGYETFTFTLLPESQEDRDKLKKYNILVEVQLLQQPIILEEI